MEHEILLDDLSLNSRAAVRELDFNGAERRRMLDLGLCEGSVVEPVLKSPLGSPVAYLICGTLIALRRCDSRRIVVTPLAAKGGI